MRHGQRHDTVARFCRTWTGHDGKRHHADLNLQTLPPRRGSFVDYEGDTPLTKIGLFSSHEVSTALRKAGAPISAVFCSPFLRCVETGDMILRGYGDVGLTLRIEPGLGENSTEVGEPLPRVITPAELKQMGYRVDPTHVPLYPDIGYMDAERTLRETYARHRRTVRYCLEKSQGQILLVCHGASLDFATREMVGRRPRNAEEVARITRSVPELAMATMEETGDGGYRLVDPPIYPLTMSGSTQWDHNILKDQEGWWQCSLQ